MVVKGEVAKRADMIGEFTPNQNTDLLLNFKKIPKGYTQRAGQIAEEKALYEAEGYPRSFLDGINTGAITTKNDITNGSDFTVTGTFFTLSTPKVFENRVDVGVLTSSYLTSLTSLPNDGGTDRSISIFFFPLNSDLVGTKTIFTQRISNNRGYHIGILDGRLYCRMYDSSGNAIVNTYITDETLSESWYHVIISHSSTNFKAFLNGVLRKDFSYSGTVDYIRQYQLGLALTSYDYKGMVRSLYIVATQITEEQGVKFGTTYYNNYKGIPDGCGLTLAGTWSYYWSQSLNFHNDWVVYSNTANDYIEFSFYGDKVDLYMRQYSSAGTCKIYLDNAYEETIDNNDTGDAVALVGEYIFNTKGNHNIRIEVITGYSEIDYWEFYNTNYLVGVHGELHYDTSQGYYSKQYFEPRGLPRLYLDDIDCRGQWFERYCDETDYDLNLIEGASYVDSDVLFDKTRKVIDLANGGYAYTDDTPSSDSQTRRAFYVWFKPSEADIDGSPYCSIVTQRSTTNRGYHLGINNIDTIYMRAYDSSGSLIINYDPSSGTVLEANKWYCAILLHDSTNYYVYLNGVLQTSGTFSGTPDYTSNFFKIGVYTSSNIGQFYGQVATFALDYMSTALWTGTDVLNFYNNAFERVKQLPDMAKQTLNGDGWSYYQKDADFFALVSDTINDELILTFTAKELDIYGFKDPLGSSFNYYIDDELQGNFNTYNTTTVGQLLLTLSWDDVQERTLKIVNTASLLLFFSKFGFDEGKNILVDESEKQNNCEMEQFTFIGSGWRDDSVLGSLHEFLYQSDRADYTQGCFRVIIPKENVFKNVGDKWFMGSVIKPVDPGVNNLGFLMFNNTVGTGDTFFRLGFYQNHDVTTPHDAIRIYGDFIDETRSFGTTLDFDKYYFFGVLVNDITKKIRIIVFNLSDSEVVANHDLDFITSTTYPRNPSTWNECYINYTLNSGFGSGKIDSFIFEGETDHTDTTILDMLYKKSYATGGDQDTPQNVLTVYQTGAELMLRKESITNYVSSGIYYSPVLETGLLEGSGKLNLTKKLPLGTSIVDIQTRTTNDILTSSPVWSSWEDVSDIGIIASPNRTYIQIRFTMYSDSGKTKSPSVTLMQILDVDPVPYARKAFSYPLTYNLNGYKEAVIHDCTNLHQIIEQNGANFITFDLPFDSTKAQYITPEKVVRLFDEYYIIRNIKTEKSNGKTFYKIYAEAQFYNLQKSPPLEEKEFLSKSPSEILEYTLQNTGWELYQCDITVTRDFDIEDNSNVLETLRRIQELFGGDLIFDNEQKLISLLEESTVDNGVLFAYKKNNENITREIDSTELANRVYVFGEDNLDFSEINSGKKYVENDISSYVSDDVVYCKEVSVGFFTDKEELLSYANYIKSKYEEPEVKYTTEAKDISVLEGLDLSYNVNDTVTVFDEQLQIELKTRIVAVDYNILVPNRSKITLSNKIKFLGDDITEFKKYQTRLKRISWKKFLNMMRTYFINKFRGIGWVNSNYMVVSGEESVGNKATVNLNNPNDGINIHASPSIYSGVFGRLKHGKTITIQEIRVDSGYEEDWYKINLSEIE